MGGEGSGRKSEFNDLYHKVVRRHQRKYYRKYREAWNLARRLGITMKEARRLLKQRRRK